MSTELKVILLEIKLKLLKKRNRTTFTVREKKKLLKLTRIVNEMMGEGLSA